MGIWDQVASKLLGEAIKKLPDVAAHTKEYIDNYDEIQSSRQLKRKWRESERNFKRALRQRKRNAGLCQGYFILKRDKICLSPNCDFLCA